MISLHYIITFGVPLSVKEYDVVIIGSGILGASTAFWFSENLDARIAIVDRENEPALHASGRNTGIIHRPFYLDPKKRRLSAWSTQASYAFWSTFSKMFGLPWVERGTLKVAVYERDLGVLDKYIKWGEENGMDKGEMALLDTIEVSKIEPEVRCLGALLVRSEASVDYAVYAKKLVELGLSNGAVFMGGVRVTGIYEDSGVIRATSKDGERLEIRSRLVINAAGGESLALAKMAGLGREYSVIYFRGDYWLVDPEADLKISRNIYSVPRYSNFPFLDPHYIVRYDGINLVGPNAAPVMDPYAYKGAASSLSSAIKNILSRPVTVRARLILNREFLSLAYSEWLSSVSKKAMASRVARFIPRLRHGMLVKKIPGGIRSQVIGRGGLAHDPIVLMGSRSIHITNYNSPGATGAPAFAIYIYTKAESFGYLEGLRKRSPRHRELLELVKPFLDSLKTLH